MAEIIKKELKPNLPNELSFKGDLKENWERYKRELRTYLFESEARTDSIRVFLDTVGSKGINLYNTINLTKDYNFESTLTQFEHKFLSMKNVVHERYILNSRKQHFGESFSDFLNALKRQIKLCEFGHLEDSILRDHIVFGIRDVAVQERLLKYAGLDLESAVDICHNSERSSCRIGTDCMKIETDTTHNVCEKAERLVPAKFEECFVPRDDEEYTDVSREHLKCENKDMRDLCPLEIEEFKEEPLEVNMDEPSYFEQSSVGPNKSSRNLIQSMNQNLHKSLPFSCKVCHRRFMVKSNLKKHILIHTGEKPHQCDICNRRFSLQENLTRHRKIHSKHRTIKHKRRPHKCTNCNKTFTCKGHLKQHMVVHTGDKPYKCEHCGKNFSTKSNLNHHLPIHSDEQHMCDYCNKSFATKQYLKKHLYTHKPPSDDIIELNEHTNINLEVEVKPPSPLNEKDPGSDSDSMPSLPEPLLINPMERQHRCNFCSKSFFIKQSLVSHMLTHSGERPYKCDECGKSFSTRGHLTEHTMIHNSVKPYQCDVCHKSFLRKWNYNQHSLIHKGKHQYKCNICNKSFAIKDYLKKHTLIHLHENEVKLETDAQEQSYYCTPCNKGFTTRQFLDRHLLTHENDGLLSRDLLARENRYTCTVCHKRLSGKRVLEIHMLTHTGSRPHQCHICSKCFSQKGSLNFHMLTHTGERPHRCDVCGKCFPSKDYLLKKHMLVHTGERPYCCESCGKRFAVKSNMNKHMLIHKSERPHQCDVCRKSFTRKQDLRKHVILHQRAVN